jgi:mRNA-degrading endonuclease RelE of RelBE toxin-antitoxin system
MFRVEFQREAVKALARMPRNTAVRIKARIAALAIDPYALVLTVAPRGGAYQ